MSFELIRSYPTHRKQYVKFKTLESDYMDIKSGVPRGSILVRYSLVFISMI